VKFFDVTEKAEDDEEIPARFRVRFTKKRGEIAHWYEILDDMKKTVFLK
jgi:hypothetical protein